MTKKSLSLVFGLFIVLSIVLSACGGGVAPAEEPPAADAPPADAPSGEIEPAKEIVFYNWSEYMDPEVYTLFEEKTGIKVIEDTFSSNEEMLAKLQGGASGYVIIVPSDYTVSIMIEEGMLAKLDHNNIPNISNMSKQFTEAPYDPGNVYCLPYQWGSTGLGYLD
ncbi:MAG TPA: extracellular solute-binding protein, partial [Anaerolineales bacterium]|nr:extracellular solute-binding protein [Anaerolineales bacterium]